MSSVRDTQLFDSSSDVSIFPAKLSRGKGKLKFYMKLINLYTTNECLWMESHKDFFNFELKSQIWGDIAEQMRSHTYPNPNPERWKGIMHRLRYNVQLEQLRESKAKFCNELHELPPKLCYSDQCTFLLKHMFDRKKPKPLPTIIKTVDAATDVRQESLAAKYMRLGRTKANANISFRHKMKTLENLRNRKRSTLNLTPEAFHQLQLARRNMKN